MKAVNAVAALLLAFLAVVVVAKRNTVADNELRQALRSPALRTTGTDDFTVVCSNATDCTDDLQWALSHTKHAVVRLARQHSPYITRPLTVRRSDFTLLIEPGAELLARRNFFHSPSAMLLRLAGCSNVTVDGSAPAASFKFQPNRTALGRVSGVLRMWRADYNDPKKYKHAEWRMAMALYGTHGVTVKNLILEESGGDGIYISGVPGSTDTLVENCWMRHNYRQGISVIGAIGLTVKDSRLSGTKGTPPEAGIDLEPDSASQAMSNFTFTQLTFENNTGAGFVVAMHATTTASLPISLRLSQCVFTDNVATGIGVSIPKKTNVAGSYVIFEDSTILHSYGPAISVWESQLQGPMTVFEGVNIVSGSQSKKWLKYPPVYMHAGTHKVTYTDVRVQLSSASLYDQAKPSFIEVEGKPQDREITGTFAVEAIKRSQCIPEAAAGFTGAFNVTCSV